jgi:hypothetical protein
MNSSFITAQPSCDSWESERGDREVGGLRAHIGRRSALMALPCPSCAAEVRVVAHYRVGAQVWCHSCGVPAVYTSGALRPAVTPRFPALFSTAAAQAP